MLTSSRPVNQALADRVHTAVAELGYRPSRVARNLRVQTSSIWAVVVPDIGNPFFTRLVRSIQDEAWSSGRTVIVCNTDEDLAKEAAAIEVLVAERVGGVIIAPASERGTDLRPLLQRGVAVVAIDRRPAADVDSVLADNRLGGAAATRELVAAGRRRLACLTGPERATTARERLEGFREVVAEAGLPKPLVAHADFRQEGGQAAVRRWLQGGASFDGLFVTNNLMTIGALEALAEGDVTVPENVSVIGFDELPWAGGLAAKIPVVIQPTFEIGHRAVQMLAERGAGFAGPARHVVLAPEVQSVRLQGGPHRA